MKLVGCYRAILYTFAAAAILALLHQILRTENSIALRQTKTVIQPSCAIQGSQQSKILYLLQTEECLPKHLRSALGNPCACQCDVAVLSYKKRCTDTLSHVKYIFNSSTSWTTGRNLLFNVYIRNQTERYLYYILMDDDIFLHCEERWCSRLHSRNPWRLFEEFLRRVRPAVAALQLSLPGTQRVKHKFCPIAVGSDIEYSPTVWYNGAFNAFHHQAVEHLLPYWDRLENISIWYSQVYNIVWSEIVFRGQVVLHRHLYAFNKKHRPYARDGDYQSVLPMMLSDIKGRIPERCRTAPLIVEWEEVGVPHGLSESSTNCLPPPLPNQTITPYSMFVC